jgi:hypothetical protein
MGYRQRIRSMARMVLTPVFVCALGWGTCILIADDSPQYSEWSAAVNLGSVVNSSAPDSDPFITKDGLSLYFVSSYQGFDSQGGADIWVSHRATIDSSWGTPQNLGPAINSPGDETGPVVSIDGHTLYFTSNRDGGFGAEDIYVSRRHNKRDDFGWQAPENLGEMINTPDKEAFAIPFEDDATGEVSLYFVSNRPGGLGDDDIYVSTLQHDGNFGPPTLVAELSSSAADRHPDIRRDGLEFFFMSNRSGSIPNANGLLSYDIWVSTRTSTSDLWSTPINVGPFINSSRHDGRPSLSFDGMTLYFFSSRPGNVGDPKLMYFDIWASTRTKLRRRN